jgi:hypothetical protein
LISLSWGVFILRLMVILGNIKFRLVCLLDVSLDGGFKLSRLSAAA